MATKTEPRFKCHKCKKKIHRGWVRYANMRLCKECSAVLTFTPAGTMIRREQKPVNRLN